MLCSDYFGLPLAWVDEVLTCGKCIVTQFEKHVCQVFKSTASCCVIIYIYLYSSLLTHSTPNSYISIKSKVAFGNLNEIILTIKSSMSRWAGMMQPACTGPGVRVHSISDPNSWVCKVLLYHHIRCSEHDSSIYKSIFMVFLFAMGLIYIYIHIPWLIFKLTWEEFSMSPAWSKKERKHYMIHPHHIMFFWDKLVAQSCMYICFLIQFDFQEKRRSATISL